MADAPAGLREQAVELVDARYMWLLMAVAASLSVEAYWMNQIDETFD